MIFQTQMQPYLMLLFIFIGEIMGLVYTLFTSIFRGKMKIFGQILFVVVGVAVFLGGNFHYNCGEFRLYTVIFAFLGCLAYVYSIHSVLDSRLCALYNKTIKIKNDLWRKSSADNKK